MTRVLLVAAALLAGLAPATARQRTAHRLHGTPIIAGQPDIRVSPGGEVISTPPKLRATDTNGRFSSQHKSQSPTMPGTPAQP